MNVLLVNVDGCSEGAADDQECESRTVETSNSDTKRDRYRRERAKKRDGVVPCPIRARDGVQAPREVTDEVILQHEYRHKTGGDYASRC